MFIISLVSVVTLTVRLHGSSQSFGETHLNAELHDSQHRASKSTDT